MIKENTSPPESGPTPENKPAPKKRGWTIRKKIIVSFILLMIFLGISQVYILVQVQEILNIFFTELYEDLEDDLDEYSTDAYHNMSVRDHIEFTDDIATITNIFMREIEIDAKTIRDMFVDIPVSQDEYILGTLPSNEKKEGMTSSYIQYTEDVDREAADVKYLSLVLDQVRDVTEASVNSNSPYINGVFVYLEPGIRYTSTRLADEYIFDGDEVLPADTSDIEEVMEMVGDYPDGRYVAEWYADSNMRVEESYIDYILPVTLNTSYGDYDGYIAITADIDFMFKQRERKKKYDRFIINMVEEDGKIRYSTEKQGIFSILNSDGTLKNITDSDVDLARDVFNAASVGETLANLTDINGETYCITGVKLEDSDFILITYTTLKESDARSKELTDTIAESFDERRQSVSAILTLFIVLVVVIISVTTMIMSIIFSKLTAIFLSPLKKLTHAVEEVRGDNLEFKWDYKGDEEVTFLSDAFTDMTQRMKSYINDITVITAQKQRIDTELSLARSIQSAMLNGQFPQIPGCDVYGIVTPAREVGGDFMYFGTLQDGRVAVIVADVSGKGVPASLYMMLAMANIRMMLKFDMSLGEMVKTANEHLSENNEEMMFCTAHIGILDVNTGVYNYVNAGHNPCLIRSAEGTWDYLEEQTNIMLGVAGDMVFTEESITLEKGQGLFLYTDGVTEGINTKEELFGEERLKNALNEDPMKTPKEQIENVGEHIKRYTEGMEQFDDITMLCFTLE